VTLEAKLYLVETTEEVNAFKSWLGERRPVLAVDTETGGLDWWREPLRLVQFGDAEAGWAIPVEMWKGLAKEAIETYEGRMVFQNAKFDWLFLEANDIHVKRYLCDDTKLMAHLLHPDRSGALKSLAEEYVDSSAPDGQRELRAAFARNRWDWRSVPWDFPAYWHYAALDCVLTAKLWEILRPPVRASYEYVYDLELAVQQIITDMEKRGVEVDIPYCEAQAAGNQTEADQLRAWALAEYGVKNLTSNAEVIRRMRDDGVVFTKLTERGGVSLDEDVLLQIKHPLAQAVLTVRGLDKERTTYFESFIDLHDGSVLHPSVFTTGARTGRMSVTRPALQTLPRGSKIRNAFVPREGNVMVLIDYDQIEMRLMAAFSQDPTMIDIIRSGEDIHSMTARAIYHLAPDDELPREKRQITKNAGFSKIYGAGPRKFAMTAGVSVAEAEQFLALYDARFPGVRVFQERVQGTIIERAEDADGLGWVTSPIGRRHPVDVDRAYKAVNYLIQGTAADVLKMQLRELDAAGLADYFVLPVHDEFVFDVPEEEAEELTRAALDVLQVRTGAPPWNFAVDLTASSEVVHRWGEKYA
jgi:DNA polymerase-1